MQNLPRSKHRQLPETHSAGSRFRNPPLLMNVHQTLRFGLAEISILVSGLTGDIRPTASECDAPTQFQCIVLLGGVAGIISAPTENLKGRNRRFCNPCVRHSS